MPYLLVIQDFVAQIVYAFRNTLEFILAPSFGLQLLEWVDSEPLLANGILVDIGNIINFFFGDLSLFEIMFGNLIAFIVFWIIVKWVIPT